MKGVTEIDKSNNICSKSQSKSNSRLTIFEFGQLIKQLNNNLVKSKLENYNLASINSKVSTISNSLNEENLDCFLKNCPNDKRNIEKEVKIKTKIKNPFYFNKDFNLSNIPKKNTNLNIKNPFYKIKEAFLENELKQERIICCFEEAEEKLN